MTIGRPPTPTDLPGDPFVRVYTAEETRIRLTDKELWAGQLVPWLKGETVQRAGVLSRRGGVMVLDPAEVEAAVKRFRESGELGQEEAGAARADVARYLGTRWLLTFKFEPKKSGQSVYTVTIPPGAKKLGLLPGDGGAAVVFASGSLFELWHGDRWAAYLKALDLSVEQILETDDLHQV
jgi:hypothetical protein